MLIYMITHNDLSISEGPVTHFSEIATNFEKLGHKILAFAPNLHGKRKKWSFDIKYITPLIKKRGIEQLIYEWMLIFILLKTCRKNRPDIIYSRQSYITFAAPFIAKFLKIPLVTEVNGIFVDDLQGRNVTFFRKKANALCEQYAYNRSKKIIGVSNLVCDNIKKRYLISSEKLVTLLNGVNTKHFSPQKSPIRSEYRSKLGLSNDDFCIGYVGCFTPFDGIEVIPQIAAKLKDDKIFNIKFVLIGDETKREDVESRIKALGVGDIVQLTGRIDYKELPFYLSAFDIGIAPYILKDKTGALIGNSSLKCLEYSAMGLPVLSTFLPQSDYITINDCGWLISANSESELYESIKEIVKLSTKELKTKGECGRLFIEKNRSWKSVAESTIAIFNDIIV